MTRELALSFSPNSGSRGAKALVFGTDDEENTTYAMRAAFRLRKLKATLP